MSITDTFDGDGEQIISPAFAVKDDDKIPERLMVFFSERSTERLLARFECEECSERSIGMRIPIYSFSYKGERIGFYRSPVTAAAAVGILEEIAFTKKHKFLFFGSCGALDKELAAGHLLVPTAAYRDEGTSYHYAAASDYIEIKSADRLAEVLDEINVSYIKTKVWTTDAFYRETKKNMLARKAEGCSAVDMECSALMACAQYRGYEVYEFVYTADCLDGDEWDKRILGKGENDIRDTMIDIAAEAIIRL